MEKQIQQGDVILKRIDYIPNNAQKLSHGILAEGEKSGHSHALTNLGIAMLFMDGDQMFIRVKKEESAIVKHEEHQPIEIPSGDWEVDIVQEYDPFEEEVRRVVD